MVPPYAIIFLGDLEERFFSDCDISSLVWWQYIDNIFMLWQHGEKALKKFLEILNSYHPTIKFTANYSREKIGFLDVEVIKKGNRLVTDLYIKPTDTLWGQKYLKLKVGTAFVKDLDVKFPNIVPTRNLTSSTRKCTYEIRPEDLNCRSENVVCLISCKTCHKQ